MAGERSRRSVRSRRSPKDEDSDDPEMSAALQLTRLDGGSLADQTKESDRLAKIQEKNRKAQQKFRERRKEKMLTMEREIQDLNTAVRQLRAEKDQLQEQLAVEKRVNSENSAKLETKPTTLSMHGLHDYDPIDMSFLPQWEGLSLSNDKIRAMPSDTLKILIQTILQDLRTRLANLDTSMSPAVGHSVTQAFAFLNRCYLVEPIRYRKVVVEMMGPGSNSSGSDSKPHINLSRDQELAISTAVETFEKRCDEVWKMRESLCEHVKQTRVSRGSELENMRSFIQVHAHIETLQESLRAENEVLVRFLGDVGRILGPAPLTHALFASGGQDIFTYCQAIHCRALMVNSGSLGSGAVNTPNSSAPGASGSLPGLPAPSPSASWLSGRDGGGSAAMTGSIPLVENLMMPVLNDSTAMDLDQQMRDRSSSDHTRRLDPVSVPGVDGNMHASVCKPPSPAPQHQLITHESPFLYGPGERSQAAGVDGAGQAVQAAMPSGFRVPKAEPGVNSGQPLSSGGEFIELFRSVDGQGGRDSTRLSAHLRSLLKDVPGSLGLQPDSPFPFQTVENPPASSDALPATAADGGRPAALQTTADLGSLAANLQHNRPAVKGFLSQLLTQQQGQQAQGQSGTSSARGSAPGSAPGRAPNLTELETLLHSKEGSRTLEILAQDLTTTRTLSAGELLSIQPEDLTQAAAQATTPTTPSQAPAEGSAPASSQSPAAQVMSGIAPVQRPRSSCVAQVTSGQCE